MIVDYATIVITVSGALSAIAALIGLVNRKKIQTLHVLVNSRLSELVASAHAEGVGEGVAKERGEARERSAPADS